MYDLGLPLFNATESKRLRDLGKQIAASFPADNWLAKAQATAQLIAATNGECTIDDVLKVCPRPDHISPNATGSVFSGKKWKIVGRTNTTKISGHSREIRIWALK